MLWNVEQTHNLLIINVGDIIVLIPHDQAIIAIFFWTSRRKNGIIQTRENFSEACHFILLPGICRVTGRFGQDPFRP